MLPRVSTVRTTGTFCAHCRLHALIAAKQQARSRHHVSSTRSILVRPHGLRQNALRLLSRFSNVRATSHGTQDLKTELGELLQALDAASKPFNLSDKTLAQPSRDPHDSTPTSVSATQHVTEDRSSELEGVARQARQAFGDVLPEGYLTEEEYRVYERLYGTPLITTLDPEATESDPYRQELQGELDEEVDVGTGLLREGKDGALEEVKYTPEEEEFDEDADAEEASEQDEKTLARLEKTKKGRFFVLATKAELDATVLTPRLSRADAASMADAESEWEELDEAGKTMYLHDINYMKLERHLSEQGQSHEADELLQFLFIRYRAAKEAEMNALETEAEAANDARTDVVTLADQVEDADEEANNFLRMHPFTRENRFGTLPSTIQLPKATFSDPITILLSGASSKHLSESTHRIFGGTGLPYSTANPSLAKTMQQKPIPIDATQSKVSDTEADAFLAAVMPGIFASVTSVMVETRKRLGSSWLEDLMTKEGGPRILDAGGAGAGVLAAREVLRAEWTRMHDSGEDPDFPTDVVTAGGQTGGAPIEAPVGQATVLTASDTLRHRASTLLDNTTFLPRLPDYIHASDELAQQRGKFDIIIAPHTLWSLKEDYLRKQHVANLWSLLSAEGGVLILLEKGVPRGFEMVAGARDFLLSKRIASPGNEVQSEDLFDPNEISLDGSRRKEKGMIIAPCTNHSSCPMYLKSGVTKGRKDTCHFEQRFIRPPFLQKIIGARDKNHEDVQFSYISVMRGRDLRDEGVVQGDRATDRAFAGYEIGPEDLEEPMQNVTDPFNAPAIPDVEEIFGLDNVLEPHSLSLPRAVLPPMKRTGHVILDLCTPSGTLERWTVPRSFSKQAFRDARKSSWGDLWALGAKTRVPRAVRLGKGREELGGVDRKGTVNVKGRVKGAAKAEGGGGGEGKPKKNKAKNIIEVGYDSEGRIKEENIKVVTGGRMRQGKIKGIRDKRDKKADGRGRRREMRDV